MQNRVLILGGNGLMGHELALRMARKKSQVTIVDLKQPRLSNAKTFTRADILDKGVVPRLIGKTKPEIIINCVNLATICSKDVQNGFHQLTHFYFSLYKSLAKLEHPVHYLQIGTTGSGGLGFNIPFTHGDKIEDFPIVNKAAFSGISTAMLVLLSRSFTSSVTISELKPGLAVFKDGVINEPFNDAVLVALDGGESGLYTYYETALLTSFMGFTTVSRLIDKADMILTHKKVNQMVNAHDIIANTNMTIIAPDDVDLTKKANALAKMKKLTAKNSIIATGNLGPPSVTRDLILAYLMVEADQPITAQNFTQRMRGNPSVMSTLAYIREHDRNLSRYLKGECHFDTYRALTKFQTHAAEPWKIVQNKLKSGEKQPNLTSANLLRRDLMSSAEVPAPLTP